MLEIILTSGTGSGPNELSAFDSALYDAGVENYNLISLSSVIPPNAKIREGVSPRELGEHGDIAYVVISESYQSERGRNAYAGLGWAVREDNLGGIFVEHEGHNEEEVQILITDSLNSMVSYRTGNYGTFQSKIVGIECEGKPVCAVVCAVYKTEGWAPQER